MNISPLHDDSDIKTCLNCHNASERTIIFNGRPDSISVLRCDSTGALTTWLDWFPTETVYDAFLMKFTRARFCFDPPRSLKEVQFKYVNKKFPVCKLYDAT